MPDLRSKIQDSSHADLSYQILAQMLDLIEVCLLGTSAADQKQTAVIERMKHSTVSSFVHNDTTYTQ